MSFVDLDSNTVLLQRDLFHSSPSPQFPSFGQKGEILLAMAHQHQSSASGSGDFVTVRKHDEFYLSGGDLHFLVSYGVRRYPVVQTY